ncbi:M48 family metallopeptidase [Okeania sp. SIO2B3]|uniref:tetratricopeptide repeat protein n=1 Tax=Okeania sp. SIO2B3 TaxID=2607784 RepID=UPI0013C15FB3|nr:tetratricopeptide repeat protein [Okeania sp. SIO2B3]NET43634.1 tetratricopeptide repeat protein [Okeania sp. SIO2B3]
MQDNKTKFPINGSVKQISELTGLFDDMWVGKKLSFTIKNEHPIQEVELQGYISDQFPEGNTFILKVDKESKQITSSPGQVFNCSIPVAQSAYQKTKIEVVSEKIFNSKQQGVGDDERDLGFILIHFNIKRGKTAAEYLKEGKKLEKDGDLEAASTIYQQAIALNPKFSWSYNKLGEALVKQGKYEEAVANYHQAVELNPNSPLFLCNLAEALTKKGDRDQAILYLEKMLKIDPDFPQQKKIVSQVHS